MSHLAASDPHAYLAQLRLLAQFRDQSGSLQGYDNKQRGDLLRKGYLGPHPPHQALAEARRRIEAGTHRISTKALDRMRSELGVEPFEAREHLNAAIGEIRPEDYRPPRELHKPPGMPFIWKSKHFGRAMYFKFSFEPEKDSLRQARFVIHSCHPAEEQEGERDFDLSRMR